MYYAENNSKFHFKPISSTKEKKKLKNKKKIEKPFFDLFSFPSNFSHSLIFGGKEGVLISSRQNFSDFELSLKSKFLTFFQLIGSSLS